jgi:hypothetical protein
VRVYMCATLCAMTLLGCVDDTSSQSLPEFPIGIVPGTRLSPKLLLADDGTMFTHPTIWKDAEFGECVFRTAVDSKYRCLPNVATQEKPMYIDTGCTQPAFLSYPGACLQPTTTVIVRTAEPTPCNPDGSWSVYTTKETIPKGTLFRDDAAFGGACVSIVTIDSPEQGAIVVLDREIPASEFVSAWR